MPKITKHLLIAVLAVFLLASAACIAVAATPRLAGEYQTFVDAGAPGYYYDLKPGHDYQKGALLMVDGKVVHGGVVEAGTWEEEAGGIHFAYTNADGLRINYNTLSVWRAPYVDQMWTFTILEKDQSPGMYAQVNYYE